MGLVSNGEEEGKGNELVRAATPLLRNSGLNYYGNVEGKEVIGGKVDVAVTDGFVGNVMLKTAEAVGKLILDEVKSAIKARWAAGDAGGLLVRPALGGIKKLLDPSEQGAAILLGRERTGAYRARPIGCRRRSRAQSGSPRARPRANVLEALRTAIEASLRR